MADINRPDFGLSGSGMHGAGVPMFETPSLNLDVKIADPLASIVGAAGGWENPIFRDDPGYKLGGFEFKILGVGLGAGATSESLNHHKIHFSGGAVIAIEGELNVQLLPPKINVEPGSVNFFSTLSTGAVVETPIGSVGGVGELVGDEGQIQYGGRLDFGLAGIVAEGTADLPTLQGPILPFPYQIDGPEDGLTAGDPLGLGFGQYELYLDQRGPYSLDYGYDPRLGFRNKDIRDRDARNSESGRNDRDDDRESFFDRMREKREQERKAAEEAKQKAKEAAEKSESGLGHHFDPSSGKTYSYDPNTGSSRTHSNGNGNTGGYGMQMPILLDLDGDGVQVTELSNSTIFTDAGGNGLKHKTAWAGAGDGVFDAKRGRAGPVSIRFRQRQPSSIGRARNLGSPSRRTSSRSDLRPASRAAST